MSLFRRDKPVVALQSGNLSGALNQRRSTLVKVFSSIAAKQHVCDIGTFLKPSYKVLTSAEKDSASKTVIVLGELAIPLYRNMSSAQLNTGIALKLSFRSLRADDNSLEIERRAYRDVSQPLYMAHNTPHVMLYFGTLHCNNFVAELRKLERQRPDDRSIRTLLSEVQSIGRKAKGAIDVNSAYVLVLERGQGGDLGDMVRNQHASLTYNGFWLPVFFQIVFTLLCFQDVGFTQNDLHSGNLWVDVLPEPHTFYYEVTKPRQKTWSITTRYMVKFFDFDRAAKVPTSHNRGQWRNLYIDGEICRSTGQCNGFPTFFDAFNIFYNLFSMRRALPQKALQWISRYINEDLLKTHWAWHGQPCKCIRGRPGDCEQCTLITNEGSFAGPGIGSVQRGLLMEMLLLGFTEFETSATIDRRENIVWSPPSSK
jgi:hypothetical protein